MVCVSSIRSSVPVSRVSARKRVVEARLGQHHAAIGQHRLGDDAGDIALGKRLLQALEDR